MTPNDSQATAVPLMEQLRSVPPNAKLRIDTPNALGCMDTRSIPVGRLCHDAAAALSALAAGKVEAIPEGWTLVPAQPSDEMTHAIAVRFAFEPMPDDYDMAREAYRAMLAASPSPLSADPESAVVGAAKESTR